MNMIGTSQLLYRIKGNAATLTIIAVLSATTLTAVGTSYSFYYNNRTNAELANPNSMMFISTDEGSVKKIDDLVAKSADHKLRYHQSVPVLEMNADVSGLESVFYDGEMAFTILSEHDFNQLADDQNRDEKLSLKGNEAVVLDPSYMEGLSPQYVGKTITLKDKQQKQQVTFKAMHKYNVLNQRPVYTTIVVSDEIFGKLQPKAISDTLEIYSITGQEKAKTLTADIEKILPDNARFSSFYDTYSKGMEASGLMIFMGGFLGLVFLAATGSIIYFKQLTEASSDKGRYLILHKIGVNKKEIRKTVAKQVGFIFALPLIAGIAHCTVALSALSNLLHTNLMIPVVICMGVYTCIYVIYYVLTVNAYYRIVTNVK
ncbi:FtsX-like permease family protein [Paenibacillus sp. D2_2]|nr:FtsX-like permease family protein [Paenibacillus sp. D2_2]WMT38826.1 FtsX-like permease family protein [Paenibacillus sp. D2_2]